MIPVRYLLAARLLPTVILAALAAPPGIVATEEVKSLPVAIGSEVFSFRIVDGNGRCELEDRRAGVTWGNRSGRPRFGEVRLTREGKPRTVQLAQGEIKSGPGRIVATFHPLTELPEGTFRLEVRQGASDDALQVSYEADERLGVESVSLLPDLVTTTDSGNGYVVVPVREGLLLPADSGKGYVHRFDSYAYEGCHMEMLGAVQNGAALLITWDDPNVVGAIRSVVDDKAPVGNRQKLSADLALGKSARSFQLRVLGKGNYCDIAKAYRTVAQEEGWLVKWDRKLAENPERAKLFGAINFNLWSALDRRMNEASTAEESVELNWTFDEAAQVAEHLKRDLQLDKVLFTVGGWIHRGYDNQHPDILPAAPECGGDAALAECARRVKQLGYLFCLHDNYQDIYRDSPSWDEKWIMKTRDGHLASGGHWAGGRAYLTCSQMAVELAKRPQNLPAVKKLTDANAYFIDTTYAAGLQECFDPHHTLTRADDMKWKQALSDYARKVFGLFGSECGREWAIPHSDFFEGLTGVSGQPYHNTKLVSSLGARVVPLFELVYRDCIAMYGKYGYDPDHDAEYVLEHIVLARPLNYHAVPPHLYWKQPGEPRRRLPLRPGVAELKQTAPREFQITCRWRVTAPVSDAPAWKVFVHFTDSSDAIKFQNDHDPEPPVSKWSVGEVRQGPFRVSVPPDLRGDFQVRMGLFQPSNGLRARLDAVGDGERSYLVGTLRIESEHLTFQPVEEPPTPAGDPGIFAKAENGWAEGLHPLDRFVKNTYEILSPLNELTAQLPMSRHRFLSADKKVQRTEFVEGSQAVTVTVNASNAAFEWETTLGGKVSLPPFGFVVDGSSFVAFYASTWSGVRYQQPPPFTVRCLDGKPLSQSKRMRVYHGFGDDQIRLKGKTYTVAREAILEL
jgi:hypothetical protein